jgi:hypothetical protein
VQYLVERAEFLRKSGRVEIRHIAHARRSLPTPKLLSPR